MEVSLEDIRYISKSKDDLTKSDLEKMANYLKSIYLNNMVKLEWIYTDDRYDMSFKVNKLNSILIINYKYYLETIKIKDKVDIMFEFFKSFIHETVHANRYFSWYKDKNECYNYTVESTIFREYFAKKGFDFYAENSKCMLMELEAEIKSAISMKKKN